MVSICKTVSIVLFSLSMINGVLSACDVRRLVISTESRTFSECRNLPGTTRQVCYYACKSEYYIPELANMAYNERGQLAGYVECVKDRWTEVKCERVCPRLPNIANGFYINSRCEEESVTHQKVCEFDCFEGYSPHAHSQSNEVGETKIFFIECQRGRWDTDPVCARDVVQNECEAFEVLPGNQFTITECQLAGPKPLCHFVCNDGLVAENKAARVIIDRKRAYAGVIECKDKQWQQPVCVARCPEVLRPIPNVVFYNNECTSPAPMRANCLFFCAPGYMLPSGVDKVSKGEKVMGIVRCSRAGWSRPACEPIPAVPVPAGGSCALPRLDLSAVSVSTECRAGVVADGTQCVLTCASGKFEGSALDIISSTCLAGNWAGQPLDMHQEGLFSKKQLTCSQKCRPLGVTGDFNVVGGCLNDIAYGNGKICTVTCIRGNLFSTSQNELTLRCCNGSWMLSDAQPLSFPLKCPAMAKPAIPECTAVQRFPSTHHSCRYVAQRPFCDIWCPQGPVKTQNKVQITLDCTQLKPLVPATPCANFCPPIGISTTPLISSSCETDKNIFDGNKCSLQCTHGPFAGLETSRIDAVCNDGRWVRETTTGVFQLCDFSQFVCPGKPAQKICLSLPALANGKLNGPGCVENALSDTKCTFACDIHLVASPSAKKQCFRDHGVISCVDGQWETPYCRATAKPAGGCEIKPVAPPRACGPRPEISNGRYIGAATNPSFFVCNTNFFAVVNETVVCDKQQIACEDGVWSVPVCQSLPTIMSNMDKKFINVRLTINGPHGIIERNRRVPIGGGKFATIDIVFDKMKDGARVGKASIRYDSKGNVLPHKSAQNENNQTQALPNMQPTEITGNEKANNSSGAQSKLSFVWSLVVLPALVACLL